MEPLRLLAPAKINLHLRVGPPSADGFHPLLSWFVTLGLCDTLTLWPAPTASAKLVLACDDPALPCDGGNLVVRAACALAGAIAPGRELSPINAMLHKRIPMGAGLGGGSSDGAAALRGLNQLWNAGWDAHELAKLGATLGSDLPFFFHGPSSICTGRGEIVRPTPRPAARWAVLILPGIHMPTPAVYKQFDQLRLVDEARLRDEPDWAAWAKLPATELLPLLVNDLEAPAFALSPALGELRAAAERGLGRPVRMSGSGSSLFTLFDERAEAGEASRKLGTEDRFAGIRFECVELSPKFADDLSG